MNRELILYIACSLDGYVAGLNGELDWLYMDQDYGYSKFIKTIDTVLLGRKTYEEILQFDVPYPYADKKSYVITSNPDQYDSEYDITFTSRDPVELWDTLSATEGKGVWLVGGGKLISPFINQNEIDQYIMAVHPIILGQGVPLYMGIKKRLELDTEKVKTYDSGLMQLFLRKSSS